MEQPTSSQSAAERLSEEVASLSVEAGGGTVKNAVAGRDTLKNPVLSSVAGTPKGAESPPPSRSQTPQRSDHAPMGVPRSASK